MIYLRIRHSSRVLDVPLGLTIASSAWQASSQTVKDIYPEAARINAELNSIPARLTALIKEAQSKQVDPLKHILYMLAKPSQPELLELVHALKAYVESCKNVKSEAEIERLEYLYFLIEDYTHQAGSINFETVSKQWIHGFRHYITTTYHLPRTACRQVLDQFKLFLRDAYKLCYHMQPLPQLQLA